MLRPLGIRAGFTCLALTGAVLAKDPNQPVQRGSAEFSGGASYARYTGSFDANGNYVKYPDSVAPAALLTPFRVRIGLGNGFEIRADGNYYNSNKDGRNLSGFTQPSASFRYTGKNGGVFTNVTFPIATGDFDKANLNTAVEIGGLLRMKSPRFRFTSLASYIDDFEDAEILRLWMRPEILWMPGFSTFVSGEFLKSLGESAYLGTLGPGLRRDFSETFAVEATTPFSVLGRNSPVAGWSAGVKALWTLKF